MPLLGTDTLVIGPHSEKDEQSNERKVVLLLETFQGKEALGMPYRYDLTLLSDSNTIPVNEYLGQPLTVRINLGTKFRYFNGIVTYFAKVGFSTGHTRYAAVLNPTLSLLGYPRNCRIFNDTSNFGLDPENQKATEDTLDTLKIVKDVLHGGGVTEVEDITQNNHVSYDRRYCVQYRETDLNFVQRLLEDEGIYYFFKHTEGQHTLVLADSIASRDKSEDENIVLYLPKHNQHGTRKEHFWSLSVSGALYPARYAVLRGYDYTKNRPGKAQTGEQLSGVKRPGVEYENYDYPGGLFESLADTEARIRMQVDQVANTVIEVEGNTLGLGVGDVVTLEQAASEHHNPFWDVEDFKKEYLITEASYAISINQYETGDSGATDEPFKARYTLLENHTQFRPQRTAPKPRIEGPQTALVVGPSKPEEDGKKEEIYTDQFARVKVKFDWDRAPGRDQTSSCWVRVAQIWAGQNWGAMHIPRVGQEVIVEFLDGDPDRPIITGRVYNKDNMPPYTLPEHKTQSGIKSRSSKAGSANNFNEIRFEDLKGKEELHIQAEKNMSTLVKNSQSTSVGADRSVSVGGNQSTTVTKNETQTYKANREMDVTGTNHDTTHQEYTGIYCQGRNNGVDGKDDVLTVTTNKRVAVTGTYAMSSEDKCSICHGKESPGDAEIIFDADDLQLHNKSESCISIKAGGITISAPETIDLKCGDACISLAKDGTITVTGKTKVVLSGGAGGATVTLDAAAAAIMGKLVKINS